jgi:hypothetical protein
MPNFFLKLCYSSCSSSFGMGAGYIKKKDPDPSGKKGGALLLTHKSSGPCSRNLRWWKIPS